MIDWDEFEVLVTITGFRHYPNARRLFKGETVILRKDFQNECDSSAIAVYLPEGQIGYIANSNETVRKNTMSAASLFELMENTAYAEVIEGTYHDALCRVEGIFDVDKVTLKAFKHYDECDYENALELFLKLGERYKTTFLMQYTADCFIKTKRYKEALKPLETALLSEPENKVSLMMQGTALEKTGKLERAEEVYLRLLEKTDNQEVKKALERCRKRQK